MTSTVRRTVLNVKVVIETNGGIEEHNNTVRWAANQVKEAHKFNRFGYIATAVMNETTGEQLGFSGHGTPASEETKEIVDDLFEN